MTEAQDWTRTEVVVVGGGPCGVIIANLLGTYGVRTLVVERSPQILDYPRAVGIDDEALRVMQAAGVADDVMRDTIANVPMRMYTADKRCFAHILPATREFGWFRRNIFSQPLGEIALRGGLQRFEHVRLQVDTELTALEQDDHGVRITLRRPDGSTWNVSTQYLIGADGGRSTVREGLLKVPFEGKTHPRKWVVIECDNDPLDAPYTALHCEPARPYVCLRLPYGLRRWEFLLYAGEDDEQILRPEKVQELLRPHVPDPARLNIIRARVYTHNSRVARHFRVGRVFLAGDAAHLTPPWIGQGLNAGIRDAANVAWKVAGVVRGTLHADVLDTYQTERHAHAKAMIDLADQVGAIFSLRNRPLAWLRDKFLLGIRHLPPIRDYVLQMRFKPMPRYTEGGVVVLAQGAAAAATGKMMIQPQVELPDGRAVRLDDACGPWFAVIGWQRDPQAQLPPETVTRWKNLGARFIMAVRARSSSGPDTPHQLPTDTLIVQDIENLLSTWFEGHGADVLMMRPDRYVGLLCDAADFDAQSTAFLDRFGSRAHHVAPHP